MSLDEIVTVTISAGTSQPTRAGFGVPLLLANHARFPENVRTYTSLAGMVSDGFTVNDAAYKMARAAFSQTPRPPKIKLGRLPAGATPHTVQMDVTGSAITGTVVSPDGTSTAISVVDAATLATALSAIAGLVASAVGATVTADADVNGAVFSFEDFVGADFVDVTADLGYDTQLDAILADDADFYFIAIDINSAANIADVAAWTLANKRLAFFGPSVTNPADYTAGAALDTAANGRAVSLVSKGNRSSYPEVAWVAEAAPFDPGSQTWAYKTLQGVPVSGWSATQRQAIEAINANHYTREAGVNITRFGVAHDGGFIDIRRGLDWLVARIQEAVFTLLINARKIPYTDEGYEMVLAALKGVLLSAESQGLLTQGSSRVTRPQMADVPDADKLARRMVGIEFTAQFQGAGHTVEIQGAIAP